MIERKELSGYSDAEQKEILECVKHNKRLFEDGLPHPIHEARFVPHQHFIFRNFRDLECYEVARTCIGGNQYMVKKLYEKSIPAHLRPRPHTEIWEWDTQVLLPSSQEIERLDTHPNLKPSGFDWILERFK